MFGSPVLSARCQLISSTESTCKIKPDLRNKTIWFLTWIWNFIVITASWFSEHWRSLYVITTQTAQVPHCFSGIIGAFWPEKPGTEFLHTVSDPRSPSYGIGTVWLTRTFVAWTQDEHSHRKCEHVCEWDRGKESETGWFTFTFSVAVLPHGDLSSR